MGVRLAVVAVLLTMAGCSTAVQGTPVSVSGATSAKPKGPQDMPKGPPDRDGKAVTAALRELDACALISPQAGAGVGYPANGQPFALGPHFCQLLAGKQFDSDELTVTVGTLSGPVERFVEVPTMIGNTRTYVYTSDPNKPGGRCQVSIPVSFVRAIRVQAQAAYGTQKDTCAQAKAFAGAVLEKLANPDSVRVDPAKRPLAAWDACALLAAGFGDEAAGRKFDPSSTGDDGIDNCGSSQDTRASSGTSTAPKPTGTTKYETPVIMGFDYSKDPATLKGQPKQIGGRQVLVNQSGSTCDMQWSMGPSGQSDPDLAHTVISLRVGDCAKGEAIITKALAAVGQAPSDKPQRPLLLKQDEPDTGAIGACVDFNPNYQGCIPAHDVPQLPAKDKLAQVADDDAAISCAIAKDPVRQKFGAEAQPVVYGEHCFFVLPDHSALIEMTLSSKFRAGDYGKSGKNRREVTVAGHPGIAFESGDAKFAIEYDTYVALGKDVDQPGHLVGGVRLTKPRGAGTDAPVDVSRAALVEPILTEILQKYFQ